MKKILVLLAGVVISFNASASYTQYNFSSDSNSDISGSFIQRDDNKAIAFYSITISHYGQTTFFNDPNAWANLSSAYNNFSSPGPTSFSVYNDLSNRYFELLSINFEANNSALAFSFQYSQQKEPGAPSSLPPAMNLSNTGIVTKSAVNASMAAYLDSLGGYDDKLNQITPDARVPEPATLGLFALGAFAAGTARRRKLAK